MATTPIPEGSFPSPQPTALQPSADPRLVAPIQSILTHKETAKQAELQNIRKRVWVSIPVIGADVLTIALLILGAIQGIDPSLSGTEIVYATMACGLVAGGINATVGIIEGFAAAQCFTNIKGNGTSRQGRRYAIDCATMLLLGGVMILSALATTASGVHTLSTDSSNLHKTGEFFDTYKFFLPTAFFIAATPVIFYEVGPRVLNILNKTDLASRLELEDIRKKLNENKTNEAAILLTERLGINKNSREETHVARLLRALQSDLSTKEATAEGNNDFVAVSKLLYTILKSDEKDEDTVLIGAQQKIESWSRNQRDRMLQQILFLHVRNSMEKTQETLGVQAAIPVFGLLHALLVNDPVTAEGHLTKAQEQSTGLDLPRLRFIGWNKIQIIRFAQQMLYILAFALSMIVLLPGIGNTDAFNMVMGSTALMLVANMIPLVIDSCCPFKRNPHIVVPGMANFDKELIQLQNRKRDHVLTSKEPPSTPSLRL